MYLTSSLKHQFETSGFLLATVHFGDVGHLDLKHLSAGGCKRYKCEAILQLDTGVLVLTAQIPNVQFETSGPLVALIHFSDVGHHTVGMALFHHQFLN